jgi:rhomboid protease GluP
VPKDFNRFKLTYTLIFLNIFVYILTALLSADPVNSNPKVLVTLGALYGPLVLIYNEWWRMFTAMFLHGGMTHLLMNMFSLYIVGRAVELYFDRRAYLAIYFSSGLIGAVASLYIHPQSVGVGASGAIFGIFGAIAGFFIIYKDVIGPQSREFMKNFGVVIAINLFLGLSIPSIDMSAHIAGLVVGIVGGLILAKHPRRIMIFTVVMLVILFTSGFYLQHLYTLIP